MKAHFESYRTSLKKDVLEGYLDYVNQVHYNDQGLMATYLINLKNTITKAIEEENVMDYNMCLSEHQSIMKNVFRALFVDETVRRMREGRERTLAILDIVYEKGWKWFKNCEELHLEYTNCTLIPVHKDFTRPMYSEKPVFDASEMEKVFSASESAAKLAVATKINHPIGEKPLVIDNIDSCGATYFVRKPEDESNQNGLVTDWRGDVTYVQ